MIFTLKSDTYKTDCFGSQYQIEKIREMDHGMILFT